MTSSCTFSREHPGLHHKTLVCQGNEASSSSPRRDTHSCGPCAVRSWKSLSGVVDACVCNMPLPARRCGSSPTSPHSWRPRCCTATAACRCVAVRLNFLQQHGVGCVQLCLASQSRREEHSLGRTCVLLADLIDKGVAVHR